MLRRADALSSVVFSRVVNAKQQLRTTRNEVFAQCDAQCDAQAVRSEVAGRWPQEKVSQTGKVRFI